MPLADDALQNDSSTFPTGTSMLRLDFHASRLRLRPDVPMTSKVDRKAAVYVQESTVARHPIPLECFRQTHQCETGDRGGI